MAKKLPRKADFRTSLQDIAEMEKGTGRMAANLDTIYSDLAANIQRAARSSDKQKKSFEDQLDIGKKLHENAKNIFNTDVSQLDLSKQIKDIEEVKAKGGEKYSEAQLKTLKGLKDQLTYQTKLVEAGKEMVSDFNKGFDATQKWASDLPLIGGFMGGIVDKFEGLKDKFEEGVGEALAAGLEGDEALAAASKAMAPMIAASMAAGLAMFGKRALGIMQELGISFGEVLGHPSFLLFKDEAMAITEEFGNINEAGFVLGAQMKLMSFWTGVTADSQAKVLGAMAATSDASLSTLHSQISSTKQLAKAAGIPFKAVMEDVATNTKLFSEYAKDGGKNIMAAAVEAKKMGVSLSDVASISESLLNFEDSITAQMEASMLLGREINLDRARQLNINKDQVGMMKEIKAQVGGEAAFNEMNVLQRRALAGAIGLGTEELAKMVREEEKSNENTLLKAGLMIGLSAAAGALAGMIFQAFALPTGGLSLAMFAGLGPGAAVGGAIGAAAGATAFAAGQGMLSFQGLPPGTGVNIQGGTAMAHAGETIVRTESINMDDTNTILIEGFDRMRKEYRNTQNG